MENLLTQGRKDSDFQANEVVQPMIELLLAQEGDELQMLIEAEVVRVTEAMILGTAIQTLKQVPAPVRTFLPPIQASLRDQASMLALREQVLRIYDLLQSSRGFDPAMLQPLVEVCDVFNPLHLSSNVISPVTAHNRKSSLSKLKTICMLLRAVRVQNPLPLLLEITSRPYHPYDN